MLSGAQTRERVQACAQVLSRNVRMLLAVAVTLIAFLLVVILAIYRRNKTYYQEFASVRHSDTYAECMQRTAESAAAGGV